jgi:hypothetical protein
MLTSHSVAAAMRNLSALRNPNFRAFVTAGAATAAWPTAEAGRIGWWEHGNGGFGWVGPLFWPFAYDDIYDYTFWGYGPPFWDYGYGNIYSAIFAPYGYEELLGYFAHYPRGWRHGLRGHPSNASNYLAQICDADSPDIVGLPVDEVRQAIQLTEEQRTALDDLTNALAKAAQVIKAACPTAVTLTAPDRLAAMHRRLEAMVAGVETVQPPLEKLYGLLDDEGKARLTALAEQQRRDWTARHNLGSLSPACGATPGITEWPIAEINSRIRPTEAQRATLSALQDAGTKAAEMLKTSCQPDSALTPPARLAAVGKRLDVMLQGVKLVEAALNDFYGMLSDEQKAQFEAIARQRVGQRA